ncbi:hypothetical protein [Streptomyces sp. NPDC059918]|uniref:hypothetical protein n=1 Tax=unclassified Streptomyces TaxID=2593676 RepID=UPI003652F30D
MTEPLADLAAGLLEAAGIDGHECVVDALVVATVALSSGPAEMISSDGSHVPKLCAAASVGRPTPVQWVRIRSLRGIFARWVPSSRVRAWICF